MSKQLFYTVILLFISYSYLAAQQTIAQKLGYAPDAKLLIIHADDIGVTHSENKATILAMKLGMVNSGSIMMPCPWVGEIAAFAQERPDADLGLHLTLTSEWEWMKWGPVAPKDQVPSLINNLGFFYDNCQTFGQKAKPAEVEIELRAQIEKAFSMGINPTHFDTHMGCLVFNSPEVFEVYLKLGREYKIPVMVDRFFLKASSQAFRDKMQPEDLIIEKTYTAEPKDFESGMANYYENVLTNLTTGIQVLLIHLAFDDAEMQALSVNHPDWGAAWRQADFDFFTSDKCRQLIKENNIQLLTWRELQKAAYGIER